MSKTNSFETSFLELIFNNASISNIGDATGIRNSATTGSLYIALLTGSSDFETADTAAEYTGSEADYTGYNRVAVVRNATNWTVSGNVCGNETAITFPAATGGSFTATHFGIVTGITGSATADMLFYGALTSTLTISSGITPEFASGSLTITED
jgi:hypothetical protein